MLLLFLIPHFGTTKLTLTSNLAVLYVIGISGCGNIYYGFLWYTNA